MRQRFVTAILFVLTLGMLLPSLSVAQDVKNLPANSLSAAVVKRLAQTPEYAKLDSLYENNLRDKGPEWAKLPEAQAMLAAREVLKAAALSARVETNATTGKKEVVFTQGGVKTTLSGIVPFDLETDPAERTNAAGIISRFIINGALADAKYQAVVAAIAAAENPPLPDINRSSASVILGASVEPPAPYPLWLPEPGPSSKADLLPRAEQARQRGLKAAGNGDWPGAIAAFKEANTSAHSSPALMFNLALAYQRGGYSVPAAMWYRAYLAALPYAPNAAEVRAEIQKLIAETEARSLRLLDEAERLTEALSATPPSAGAKSLRQQSIETIAAYAYLAGMKDRGDALVRKAAALPGANDATEKKEYPDKHGLYGAAYSWDAKRVEDIVARFGSEYTPEMIFNYRIYASGMNGDLNLVRKILDAYPSGLLSDLHSSDIYKQNWMTQNRAYEILEIMDGRRLSVAKKFDQTWYMKHLMPSLQSAFWEGRPDIAQRLARRAVEYYRKFNPERSDFDSYWGYIIPNSLLGDRKAIVQEMGRWKTGSYGDGVDIAALLAAGSMAPGDAEATILEMVRWKHQPHYEGASVSSETIWPLLNPEAYFALAIAKGDSTRALKYLERGDPSSKEYQDRVWRALRFAVATGRSQLAHDLSEKLHSGRDALVALNRLAANPGAGESVRERVSRYAASVSGGWRPSDATHARKVWLHLQHARYLSDEKQYGLLTADADKTAKEKPEQLPAKLAGHAVVLWMGAMAARLED